MRQTLLAFFTAILLLCPALTARAQYVPEWIEQSKGKLLDDNGEVMPDYMVKRLIGDEIYEETYKGARTQYKIGKVLTTVGIVGMGVGVAVAGVSLGYFIADYIKIWGGTENIWDTFTEAKDSVSWFYRGCSIVGTGYSTLTVGLIIKTIGWKRLEWVASNYNEGNRPPTLHVGLGQYGAGLVLNF